MWTIPNAIGFVRAALIPTFFVLAMNSDDGRETTATILIGIAGATDYLDGLAARLTGQFSRFGTLLDPLVDRLLIIATAIVIFHFDLLPDYLMVLVLAREVLMMLLAAAALALGLQIHVNWIGRLAVWPLMLGGFLALCTDAWIAGALVWVGMVGSYAATFLYVQTMLPQLRSRSSQNLNQ
ncbi:MAG: CDP-alcohol phosphatidyltransferase family protein [Actinobacteria bacterium]|nr:CDP-alcohol phosphatidyltransferase family protein [Actinomycetota bacterium]